MKSFIIFIAVIVTRQVAVTGNSQWTQFKNINQNQHGDVSEEQYLFQIFQENTKLIEEHNEKFEMTEIMQEEFLDKLRINTANKPQIKYDSKYHRPLNVKDAVSVDWRFVNDQDNRGFCWSLNATVSMEDQTEIVNNKLVSFSEEQLVYCTGGNTGCMGGLIDYVGDNYPYEGGDGSCRYQQSESVSGHIIEDDHDDLKSSVITIGSISVTIDASHLLAYLRQWYIH